MKIALLCPGPSLANFPGREVADCGMRIANCELKDTTTILNPQSSIRNAFDVLIAVNRAALHVAADYWVMLDGHTFDFGEALGHPVVVARASMLRQMRHKLAARPHETLPLERIDTIPRQWPAKWDTLSCTAALALAAHLIQCEMRNAECEMKTAAEPSHPVILNPQSAIRNSIDAWGVDWQGTADWDGFSHVTQRRDEARWAKERGIWNALVELLGARGIAVARHALDKPPAVAGGAVVELAK